MKKFNLTGFFFLSAALHGCLYPEAPDKGTARSITPIPRFRGEWVEMAPQKKEIGPAGKRSTISRYRTHKNLLFIATDDVIRKKLEPELHRAYKREVRLEDVLWWHYAPKVQGTYRHVMRVYWDGLNFESLSGALRSMESLQTPYDVMLLAHGIPNHIVASPGQGVISYEHIAQLPRLKYADTLYLQACYGDTLQKDFLDVGFARMIGFEQDTMNFFYPEFYLDALVAHKGDTFKAHQSVVDTFETRFKWNPMAKEIMKRVFGMSPEDYFKIVDMPKIYTR